MPPDGRFSGLLTDLYELTMAAGYVEKRFDATATFELFVRQLPPGRNYLVAAGLAQALDFVEGFRFSPEDVAYLRSLPIFHKVHSSFFDFLTGVRFQGSIWALPEGTIFFPGEPVLRVTAPIAVGQLLETGLLSILHFQTLIASKAARVTAAAGARPVVEFGSRRAHGIDAGVLAARAAFIAGCAGTSNTYAGRHFGIPVYGTQAHSWIMAHEDEAKAFSDFLDIFPEQSVLLVDTYDVRGAVEKIIACGRRPSAIRLDSGDVVADSIWARKRLDQAGWNDVRIFVSGDLDEHKIEDLARAGAPIDAFGVGTALSTSSDTPHIGVIYKLVEILQNHRTRFTAKFTTDKKTYPGRKQVFRFIGADGKYSRDMIGLHDEIFPGAEPLLIEVMRNGERTAAVSDSKQVLTTAQTRFAACRSRLPAHLLANASAEPPYHVECTPRLEKLSQQTFRQLQKSAKT